MPQSFFPTCSSLTSFLAFEAISISPLRNSGVYYTFSFVKSVIRVLQYLCKPPALAIKGKGFLAFISASLLKFSSRRLNDGGSCCKQKFLKERLHAHALDVRISIGVQPSMGVFNIFSYRLIIGPPDFCFPASTMSNAGFKINAKRSWIYLL